ncbi:DUF4386 domain-containing protein [Glycomyces sp. L485]|uniref:DUF4386 domain-containing protein n=1 Tax=Glycomyces sp. L485 TaxID=2909235 RepID=UPI001F4B2CF6|nr:DUF4386 domain-containing protein [Glycomyces sp. L485]MCH7229631.1 DUF4386 domain-containing protein [Glycomyces sp. L485]
MTLAEAPTRSLRPASLTAGISLFFVIGLAFFGAFGAVDALVTPGDAAQTAADIAASETLFRWGIACLAVVAMLDLVLAASLYVVFETVNRAVSMLTAWFRVAFAAVYLVAISQLVLAVTRLDHPEQVLASIEAFEIIWNLGLLVFGVYLVLLGWLAYRASFMAKVVGVLLVVAGLGYLVDSFGMVLVSDYSLQVVLFTFVGEVVLMLWLLFKGTRTTVEA